MEATSSERATHRHVKKQGPSYEGTDWNPIPPNIGQFAVPAVINMTDTDKQQICVKKVRQPRAIRPAMDLCNPGN